MPLGQELSDLFRAALPHTLAGNREEVFFRNLIDAFTNLRNYSALEIHGRKSHVKYTPIHRYFTRQNPICELADVAVVAYSPRRQQARLVLIQNKLAPKHNNAIFESLCADLIQFELLHHRPVFEFAKKSLAGTPITWLNASPTDSITLYGIFYQDGHHVNMSAITANAMTTDARNRNGMHPKATITYSDQLYQTILNHGTPDFIAASNLVDFGDLLEILFIGCPLTAQLRDAYIDFLLQTFPHPTPQQQQHIDALHNLALQDQQNEDHLPQAPNNPMHFARSIVFLNVDRQG